MRKDEKINEDLCAFNCKEQKGIDDAITRVKKMG